MNAAIVALFAAVASAQAADDAQALLQQVIQSAQNTASWRVEGKVVSEVKSEFTSNLSTQPFKLFLQGRELRYEVSGPAAGVTVHNGSTVWQYTAASNSYMRRDGFTGRFPTGVLAWETLAATMPGAAIVGRDQVEFDGQPRECELVRSEARSVIRTLCIERSSLLVLRDATETSNTAPNGASPSRVTRTITYSRIDRNQPLEASLFDFQPPAGAVERQAPSPSPLVQPQPLPAGVYRIGGGVTAPRLLSKIEPTYSPEANAARLQGTVVLTIEVGPDGIATNIRVQRSLGLGLDERAIEAVKQWRFAPGEKDGKPVSVQATIEVNFRLLDPPR